MPIPDRGDLPYALITQNQAAKLGLEVRSLSEASMASAGARMANINTVEVELRLPDEQPAKGLTLRELIEQNDALIRASGVEDPLAPVTLNIIDGTDRSYGHILELEKELGKKRTNVVTVTAGYYRPLKTDRPIETVLIAEDDGAIQDKYRGYFNRTYPEVKVIITANGQKALDRIQHCLRSTC
jgi:hypothetical protein